MSNAANDANNLDAALKKGTGSARNLSIAMAEGGQNIAHAARAAGELAEAIAKASNAAKFAEGIGTIVTVLLTAVAATVLWETKQRAIKQAITETAEATKALNAEAVNSPREAAEIRILAEKQKQLHAIDEEKKALLGLGGVLHDYSKQIAAVNEQAVAAIRSLNAGVTREFNTRLAQVASDTVKNSPNFVFKGDEERQLILNELARQDEVRQLLEQKLGDVGPAMLNKLVAGGMKVSDLPPGVGGDFDPIQLERLIKAIGDKFTNLGQTIQNEHIKPLGDQLGRSFADSIAGGIAAGLQSGSIQKGFKALLGGMLSGLGHLMVEIGTQSLLAASLFSSVIRALKDFAPEGAILPSLALIALGGALEAAGGAVGSGGGGGGGGYGGGYGGGSGGTVIDRGIINPLNSAPGAILGRSFGTVNATIIGVNDPSAQRMLQEMVRKANARGSA